MNFRVESGDEKLKQHLLTAQKNARYTAVETENEIIQISAVILWDDIVKRANESVGFSLLADESADISGTEQLSIGIRFMKEIDEMSQVREEFLGFVPIVDQTAVWISEVLVSNCELYKLDLNKLIGQGYDRCSAMDGKEGGVQAIIRTKFPKAIFVHCSSHRLNLVDNYLNNVIEIRNSTETIKSVIKFFSQKQITKTTSTKYSSVLWNKVDT